MSATISDFCQRWCLWWIFWNMSAASFASCRRRSSLEAYLSSFFLCTFPESAAVPLPLKPSPHLDSLTHAGPVHNSLPLSAYMAGGFTKHFPCLPAESDLVQQWNFRRRAPSKGIFSLPSPIRLRHIFTCIWPSVWMLPWWSYGRMGTSFRKAHSCLRK